MRKAFAIVAAAVAAVVIISFLAFFTPLLIFHSVSTDKNTYSQGENVLIRYSDFGFGAVCSCRGGLYLEIYHLEDGKWEYVLLYDMSRQRCMDGTLHERSLFGCDVVYCTTGVANEQMNLTWDMKIFEKVDGICGNQSYVRYEETNAPAGTYKAKYGMAEAIFYIR
jgi:hypothetical protein